MQYISQKLAPEKKWALLIYIAGDNNLSDYGLTDIQELCDEGSSDQVYVGVEIDTYGEHTGSIRYEITEPDWTGKAHRTVIDRLPEKDSGDPETLLSFLNWGLNRYKAENYLLVVWNHGSGFRHVRRDIGYDDFGSSLDMPEIENALRRAGINQDNKIAIMGFDACLMSMLEIAHHFREQTDIIIGSQQTEPADGWPYDKVLKAVKQSRDSHTVAKKIVDEYISYYRNHGVFGLTQSAIQLIYTENAINRLSELGNLLAEEISTCRNCLREIRMDLQTFEMADYVDIIHLCELIAQKIDDQNIKETANKVIASTKDCILSSKTLGSSVQNANGLSVWFPAYDFLYYNYRAKYLSLAFASDPSNMGWVKFLDKYHYSYGFNPYMMNMR